MSIQEGLVGDQEQAVEIESTNEPELEDSQMENTQNANEADKKMENQPSQNKDNENINPQQQFQQNKVNQHGNDNQQMLTKIRIADLPFEMKQKIQKNFWENFANTCMEEDYIDAQDTIQKWCLSQIIAKDENGIRCHFDGWSSKYDIWYRWSSYRIAPFRKYSRGYTGQLKTPLRQNLNFDIQMVRHHKEKVQKIIDSDFYILSAKDTTQYLRGGLFVTIDFLMTSGTYTDEEVDEINDFFKAVLRLIVAWLKKAPKLIQKCMPELRQEPDLFLVDEDAALLQSAGELMGILERLFCSCHRCLRYYVHYDRNAEYFANSVTKDFSDSNFLKKVVPALQLQDYDADAAKELIASRSDELVYGQALNFLNYFADIGGFKALIELLRDGNTRAEPVEKDPKNVKNEVQKELMPLDLLADLTRGFLNCGALMSETFAKSFVESVRDIFTQRLMGMKDKEIKELDKDSLPLVLQSFRSFLLISMREEEISKLVEQIQLSLAARFLKSTYLEKRLKGVGDLRNLIERVEARGVLEKQRLRAIEKGIQLSKSVQYLLGPGGQKIRPTQYLDPVTLKNCIVNERVAETIFGEGAHPEIVKRAAPILRFLCQQGAISNEIVDLVWKCQQGKHEETVRVVYGLINDVVDDLPIPLLDSLAAKVLEVPEAQYTEMYLHFLKEFTLRALGSAEQAQTSKQNRQSKQPLGEDLQISSASASTQQIQQLEEYFSNHRHLAQKDSGVNLMQKQATGSDVEKESSEVQDLSTGAGGKLYGIPVLWNIVQDSYQTEGELSSSETLRIALDALCEILASPIAQRAGTIYMLKSIDNLKAAVSLYQSTCIIISVIAAIESSSAPQAEEGSAINGKRLIETLDEQLRLVEIVVQGITLYDSKVKEALKSMARKNRVPPEKGESYIFYGRTSHHATLMKLLELLEFVVMNSDSKVSLRSANIDVLWKIFVLSPNFTQDQNLFLQFINKKRMRAQRFFVEMGGVSQEAQLLTPEVQKHLFTQILCNPTYVDYEKLTNGLSKCFHTYFRLINQDQGCINHQRRKVEVLDFEHLIGLDSLWRISVDSENEKAREEARELLVDLHLRLASVYNIEAKRRISRCFIERSMRILVEASDDIKGLGAERKALSVIQVLAQFLDRYEGIKPVKPELKTLAMNYSHFQPWTVTVICRIDGQQNLQEARMLVSQFESLGAVRERCAALFRLEINEFLLHLKSGLVDPDEDDDHYVKDHDMSLQMWLSPNPSYDKKGHPKYLIAKNQDYFQLLFALLSKNSASLVEPVWELLQKLPVNEKLHQDLSQLQGAQEGWDSLLDSKSTHKLLYSLKIIENLHAQPQGDQRENRQVVRAAGSSAKQKSSVVDFSAWKRKFIELGGFRHLLDTLTGLQIDKIDTKLTLKCIESILAALVDFVHVEASLQEEILLKREAVVLSCLRYVHLIGDFTLQVEQQRGESIEEIEARRTQKRLAKQKMKHLSMVGPGNEGRRRGTAGNDDDSEEEEDETSRQINQLRQEFTAVQSVVQRLFHFMNDFIFGRDKVSVSIVAQYPALEDLFKVTMLNSENSLLRRECGSQIRDILVQCSCHQPLGSTITTLLQALLIKVLPTATENDRRCSEFFDQVRLVIKELRVIDFVPIQDNLRKLILKLATAVETRETKEVNATQEDKVLRGMVNLLAVLLQKYPSLKGQIGARLVPHLLHDCLFEIPHGTGKGNHQIAKPKCKSYALRSAALTLLSVLSRDCLGNLKTVLDYIRDFGRQASWRTNKTSDWSITHYDDEKSSTGYVGLKNLGCICYMISLFQQLFMVPSFRSDILAVDDPNHDKQEPDENMFYQLQALFTGLLKSEKQYANPKGFCHAFKDWEGQPTNVLEQMDAEEFLQMFLDRLENAIKGSPQEKTIQFHFGGKFASEMICKGCPHQYERPEPFLSIGIPVKNKKSIQEGLSAFVQGDMLEGDNAYLCAKCDRKVDTLKRTCVKVLPRNLIMTLKRFEFDFDRMVRVKLNDYCEFPLELDMLPYTQEGLARKERATRRKQEAAERGEEVQEDVDAEPLKHDKDYYQFKLKGVVVHTGTADSGHYYSFIRDHESQDGEKWYEFNDNIVRDFDIADLPNETFGGHDVFNGQGMMQMKSQKWRNAYIVIYERKNQSYIVQDDDEVAAIAEPKKASPSGQQLGEMIDEESESKKAPSLKLEDPEHPIQQKIRLENQKYWQNKFLFGKEYFEFVSDVTHYWDSTNIVPKRVMNKNNDAHIVSFQPRQPADPNALHPELICPSDEILDLRAQHTGELQKVQDASHEVFKFAATFYLTILQRAHLKALVPRVLSALKAYLNHDTRNGEWLLSEFSNWEIIKEMLLQPGQHKEMPKLTCGLLYCAMLPVYEKEKQMLVNFWRDDLPSRKAASSESGKANSLGVLGNFILLLLSHIYALKPFALNMPHYFQLLARFASLGSEAREFLLRASTVGRCMDLFYESSSPYRQLFSDMSDFGAIRTNAMPDIGLPIPDNKVRTYFQTLQEKRRRQALAGAPLKHKYLIELVSTCVRHLCNGGAPSSPYQLDAASSTLRTFVQSQEADIFLPEAKFLKRFVLEAKRTRSMWALAKALCHYALLDGEQYEELYRTVEAGLNDQDYDLLRPFLTLFEVLLETAHPSLASRRVSWLEGFIETVRNNSCYYKWMESIFEFIFKITSRNPAVREWFYNNESSWQFLVEWVSQHQRAPGYGQGAGSGVRLFKLRQNVQLAGLQHFSEQGQASRNALNAAYRVRKLQELMSHQVPDLRNEPDPDRIDLQDFKFVPGDIVSLYHRKRDEADQWRVQTVLDEMILLQSLELDQTGKYTTRWQKCDTDKLLFGDTYRNLTRTKIRRELMAPRSAPRESARGTGANVKGDTDEKMQENWQDEQNQHRSGAQSFLAVAALNTSNNEPSSEEYGSNEEDQADMAG